MRFPYELQIYDILYLSKVKHKFLDNSIFALLKNRSKIEIYEKNQKNEIFHSKSVV